MDIILALDQGSSSSRTLAVGADGSVVAQSQAPVRPAFPKDGWVEFDPDALLETQRRTLESVLRRLPKGAEVKAAGIACQRSTVVFWDAKTGKAAGPALSWQDNRAAAICEGLARHAEEIHLKTGLLLNPFYSLGKILWTLENDGKVRRLLDAGRLRLGPVSTWLLWHLTRGEVFAADPTLAQRTLLFDIRKLDWDPGLLRLAGLPREALPEVRPSAGAWGELRAAGRRFPVTAVLGDQQAAAFGLGVDRPGATAANYGTGAFLLHHIGPKPRHIPGLLTSVALQEGRTAQYFIEGTVNAAGTALEWMRGRLGLGFDDAEIDALYAGSTHRVLALLALGGLGAPRWDTKVLSGFLGLRPVTRREDLVRGTLDSIAFLVTDIADAMAQAGLAIREVRASGGLSRVDGLLQCQADLLQAPVLRLGQREATALGTASLAARAAGARLDLKAETDKVFDPRMKAGEAQRLKDCWRTFVEGFQSLSRDPRVFEAMLDWSEIFPPTGRKR